MKTEKGARKKVCEETSNGQRQERGVFEVDEG
jgi:hypothetical protein